MTEHKDLDPPKSSQELMGLGILGITPFIHIENM